MASALPFPRICILPFFSLTRIITEWFRTVEKWCSVIQSVACKASASVWFVVIALLAFARHNVPNDSAAAIANDECKKQNFTHRTVHSSYTENSHGLGFLSFCELRVVKSLSCTRCCVPLNFIVLHKQELRFNFLFFATEREKNSVACFWNYSMTSSRRVSFSS